MWLVFIPIVLLVMAVFMVASLFAGLAWLIGAGWPWLLIGLGLWLFWHEDGRHRGRGADSRGRWDSRLSRRATGQPPVAAAVAAAGRDKVTGTPRAGGDPRPLRRSELPIDVQVKVEQIRRKVDVLLGYADRFPPFSQDLYLVRQTASEYLPRTLNAYLAMPKQSAQQPVGGEGQTAHQELKAQLDLLDRKLDDIAQDLQRQDADRLLANRRFLEARFGRRDTAAPPAEVA